MPRRLSRRLARLIAPLMGILVRLYFLTIRVHDEPRSAAFRRGRRPRAVYALWHSHQLSAIWQYRHCGAATLASAHRDAQYPAMAARSLGYTVVRGSSTRGGEVAFRELLTLLHDGHCVALTTDGPRGPRHVVKPGIIHLAARAGVPVIPLAIGHSSCWTLKSWDRFRIPKPFSRGYALWGEPVWTPPMSPSRAELETARLAVETQLERLEAEADRMAHQTADSARHDSA